MVAVGLALAASVTWGLADFFGGLRSRTLDVLAVLVISQGTALVLLAAATAIRGQGPPGAPTLAYAMLAGAAGVVGLAAFYRGLAVGAMAVVAPIAGLAAAIPVAVGVIGGERPSALQAAGVVVALGGVVLVSSERAPRGAGVKVAAGAGLALLAAAGFGTFLAAMGAAGDGDVLWALLEARATSVALLAAAALVLRPGFARARPALPSLAGIGLLDMGANGLFALASTKGLISVTAVLSSLYPVVTVLMARAVLAEHARRSQQFGVVVTLTGAAMLAAG